MTTTLSRPAPRAGILDIEAYVPGKSPAKGSGKTFKLSSNETPFGPSQAARDAYEAAAKTLDLYPDGAARVLREAIAARFGLDANRIVCGCGSDDLLHLLAAAYIGPGDEGIMTKHGFQIYYIAIQAAGGTPIISEEKNYTADVDDIRAPRPSSSPIPTIRPAPICRSRRSSACTLACRRMCCWYSTLLTRNMCARTITRRAWKWCPSSPTW